MATKLKADYSYIPCLDGLRAISILLVVFAHFMLNAGITKEPIPGGLGVTIFFFISGFIITRLLLAESNDTEENKFSLKNFYIRRTFRILPALYTYITACIVLMAIAGEKIIYWQILPAVFHVQNYFIIFCSLAKIKLALPFGILWSLSIEEHFYLIFPFMVYFFRKNHKAIIYILIATVVLIAINRLSLVYFLDINRLTHYSPNYTYMATDCRLDSIAYGCLLSLLANRALSPTVGKLLETLQQKRWFILGILLMLISLCVRSEFFRETLRYSVQGIGLFLICFQLIFTDRWAILHKAMENRVVTWIGKISFSLYLWHNFCYDYLATHLFGASNGILNAFFGFLVSYAVATISYKFIEKPLIIMGKKFQGSH